jgi:uncharacterized protein YukE
MSFLPDPAALFATADRIGRHADALRLRASRLAMAAANARWESPASRAFRAEVDALGRDMNRAADRIDDAADTLRRHAGLIEAELDLERALVHGAGRVAMGAVRGVETVAGGLLDAGQSVLSMVGL